MRITKKDVRLFAVLLAIVLPVALFLSCRAWWREELISNANVQWSVDARGETVVLVDPGRRDSKLVKYDLASGRPELSWEKEGLVYFEPSISADGRIAVATAGNWFDRRILVVLNADGSRFGEWKFRESPGQPVWLSDERIAFWRRSTDLYLSAVGVADYGIDALKLRTGDVDPIWKAPKSGYGGNLFVAPNTETILTTFQEYGPDGECYLLEIAAQDGEVLLQKPTPEDCDSGEVVFGDSSRIVLQASKSDLVTGRELWKYDRQGDSWREIGRVRGAVVSIEPMDEGWRVKYIYNTFPTLDVREKTIDVNED